MSADPSDLLSSNMAVQVSSWIIKQFKIELDEAVQTSF